MGQGKHVVQASMTGDWAAGADGVFSVKGQVLHVLCKSPFNELLDDWPVELQARLAELGRQGRWGQMIECRHSAALTPPILERLRPGLAQRYSRSSNNPVTAVVCAPQVEGGLSGGPKLVSCLEDAGLECRLFKDYPTALDWIDSRIRPLSLHVEWRPEYRLGETGMDEQHRELFGRAAYVVGATSHQGQVMAAMRLFQYMRSHVSYEDELMRRHDYPHIEEHRERHRDLMSKLGEISQSIANEDMVLVDLEEFVESLFLRHMDTDDRKLAQYLQRRQADQEAQAKAEPG